MLVVATLVLVAVTALWLYAGRGDGHGDDEARVARMGRRWIIGGGVILPSVAIALLLAYGIPAGHRMLPLAVEGEVLRIQVTGHQWWWEVEYPDAGIRLENEIHVPVGVPVDLHLTSADVIHSFWVPRLGGKLDMLPGRTHVLRLEASEAGVYRGQCAEFCGLHHAHMKFTLTAHPAEDFAAWLREAAHD